MIQSVHEEVFSLCCEFVYTGDYSAPSPIPEYFGDDVPQPKDTEIQCQRMENRWNPSNLTWNLFDPDVLSHNYDILLNKLGGSSLSEAENDLSNDPFTSYAAVFISHAETHRFALRTGWTSLMVFSSYRLLRLLANFTLHEERIGDIVRLLELVFEYTGYMENLENMLRDYMVWNVEVLMQNANFRKFLEHNPSLEQTIFRAMWE